MKQFLKLVTLSVFFLLRVLPLTAQEEILRFRQAFERIDEVIEQTMHDNKTPGLALALTTRTGLIHLSNHGFSNSDARIPVTSETLFGIGSIGKSFTAVAVLQLRDLGKLDVQAPVSKYLPWFQVHSTIPITVHHLLTHTAGLPNMRMELTSSRYQAFWLTESPDVFEPGKRWHYSSAAWDILSTLIQQLGDQTYSEFILRGILIPLGMTHSEPAFRNSMRTRLASSYEFLYDDRPAYTTQPLVESNWFEYGGGAGSPAATAQDLAAYLRMLLNRGEGPHQRILSEESFKLLTQHAVERGVRRYYGYGLEVVEQDGHILIGHDGGVQGFHSTMWGDLDDGLGVVVLANGPGDVHAIGQFALQAAQAALHKRELPALPPRARKTKILNAADYSGTYRGSNGGTLKLHAEGDQLILDFKDQSVALEEKGKDLFLCTHPDLDLFLFRFGRAKDVVVEVLHGSDWYVNDRYHGPRHFQYPSEWNAYPGHYRVSSRHHINFRVVLRNGKLWFVSSGGDETPLILVKGSYFQIGDSPEWLQFGAAVNGETLQVNYSGADYHRDFTP